MFALCVNEVNQTKIFVSSILITYNECLLLHNLGIAECLTRSKTSTFGLTYCQIEILQIRKKQNIKNKRTAHLQHSAVQFSTSTFAVHYSTIQYQHICSTVLNIYSTFQVTCTFAAHYSTIQHQYISSTLH